MTGLDKTECNMAVQPRFEFPSKRKLYSLNPRTCVVLGDKQKPLIQIGVEMESEVPNRFSKGSLIRY